jgi:hypothetical protein
MESPFIGALKAEISALEDELSRDPRFAKLSQLKGVLSLYLCETVEIKPRINAVPQNGESNPKKIARATSPRRAKLFEAARLLLRNKRGMVTTREILEHIQSLELEVPGSQPLNNLSAMFSNSPDFVSHGRAGWTLSEIGGMLPHGVSDIPSRDEIPKLETSALFTLDEKNDD